MIPFLRRLLIVCLAGFAILLVLELSLTRDAIARPYFTLEITGTDAEDNPVGWTFTANEIGNGFLDGQAISLEQLLVQIATWPGALELTGSGTHRDAGWQATITNGDIVLIGVPGSLTDLATLLRRTAEPEGLVRTKAVTVADVLAAAEAGEIPMPTRTRVSFHVPNGDNPDDPIRNFSYRDAFGTPPAGEVEYELTEAGQARRNSLADSAGRTGAADDDEPEITITKFGEAPMLANLDSMPSQWRQHYPDSLPPVADRLPQNPAVVVGPDGLGNYGGMWRRATGDSNDLGRKVGYESFIRMDPAGRIQPGLAYRVTQSPDNRVYTFYLRKGHKWSDGEPFTTKDILWVTNELIGSAYWLSSPNWMMETNGHAQLFADDVLNWQAFAATVLAEAASDAPSAGKQIAATDAELLNLLKQVPPEGAPNEDLQYDITNRLNKLFRNETFFDTDAFGGPDRQGELAHLQRKGYSRLTKDELDRAFVLMDRNDLFDRADDGIGEFGAAELNRLNLLMFRLNYAKVDIDGAEVKLIDRARIKKVKIEAVPDPNDNGNDDHIIRFTFPKPNSIFLEKTGTFMFYRGLFSIPRHYTAKDHPGGYSDLRPTDILDWAGLCEAIGQGKAGSPAERVWTRLAEPMRERVRQTPPSDGRDEDNDYKSKLCVALNAVFADPTFYDRPAWEGVPLDAELADHRAEGVSSLSRDRATMNLMRQLLVREDLVNRVHDVDSGIESLSREDVFAFNLLMFRAAFDRRAMDEPLVAINREDGLNIEAQNHPRKYSSWLNQAQKAGYHPTENFHKPTLRPWRVVSEKMEQTHIAIRNPYYYRVDREGNQLPYIDGIENRIEKEKPNLLLTLKSGNISFQSRAITFEDFTLLKSHENDGKYDIRLWANDYCGEVTFIPLQARKDDTPREKMVAELLQSATFRHALSYALNRQEIIDVVFGGLGTPAQFSVPKGSPYYTEAHATMAIEYDPAKANAMLDNFRFSDGSKLGRRKDGIRLLPDGSPLILNADTKQEHPLPAVQLACAYWQRIGIDARMKIRGGELLNRMIAIGFADIIVHKEGGNFMAPLQAGGYAPTHPAEAAQWSQWAGYLRSGGRTGWEAPDHLRKIDRMWSDVLGATSEKAKRDAWQVLAEQTARDLPRLGIMTSPGKIIYVKRGFMNVPKLAMAGWIAHEPGNSCPEVFYMTPELIKSFGEE